MTFASSNVPPASPLSYTGQVATPYIVETFDPTSSNNQFNVPTIWINKSTPSAWILDAKPGGVANWIQIAGESGPIFIIDGDSGSAEPSGGVITISGGTTGLTTSGTAATVSLTGTLSVDNGGTETTSFTPYSVLCGGTTSTGALQNVVGVGTSGQALVSAGASALPAWGTLPVSGGGTGASTFTANGVLYGNGTSSILATAAGNNGILTTNSSGIPGINNTLGAGFTYTTSVAGSTTNVTVENTDNTNIASHAALQTRSGGTSGGDSYYSPAIGTTIAYGFGIDNQSSGDPLAISTAASGDVRPGAGTKLWNMTSSGQQTMPLQPSFSAIQTANVTDVTGDSTAYTVIFGTELFDRGSNYDNTTGIFTAPVTGIYHFSAFLLYQELIAAATPSIQLQTTARNYTVGNFGGSNVTTSGNMPINISLTVPMTAGDTAKIVATVSDMTKVVDIYGTSADARTCFSGFLVC